MEKVLITQIRQNNKNTKYKNSSNKLEKTSQKIKKQSVGEILIENKKNFKKIFPHPLFFFSIMV